MIRLFGLGRPELIQLLEGEKTFRANQVFEGLYAHRWTHWEEFTTLPIELRTQLQSKAQLGWDRVETVQFSQDSTEKWLFRLEDGLQVEAVRMPYPDRLTLCLSTQAGCAMACQYCATGSLGLQRNLTAGEILSQVAAMSQGISLPLNLVFMGMGEPLNNLKQLKTSFEILTDSRGFAIPPRRITVSTVGWVPGIQEMASWKLRPRLALSLNAGSEELRARLMPISARWGLQELRRVLEDYPFEKTEQLTLEYLLLKDVNDSLEEVTQAAEWAKGLPAKFNFIPFNPHEGSGFQPTDERRINALCRLVARVGFAVTVRRSRGQDISGACGQLAKQSRMANE